MLVDIYSVMIASSVAWQNRSISSWSIVYYYYNCVKVENYCKKCNTQLTIMLTIDRIP